jgi:two-component system response regulator HydG
LAHYFLQCFARENKKDVKGFSPEVEKIFLAYSWPGNVRELKNVIERAVIISKSHYIQVQDLPPKFNTVNSSFHAFTIPLGLKMKQIEEIVIRKTLAFTKGNKLATAKMLGISLATLYRHLK